MTIHIYDGMACLRKKFDTDLMGRGVRNVFMEMLTLSRSDVAIWCFEGRGAKEARRRIYSGYKDRPSTMTTGIFALVNLTRDVLKHTRALQVEVAGREADDVIAHLCQTHGPTAQDGVIVHTVDRDLQALKTDKVSIDLLGGKPLKIVVNKLDPKSDVYVQPHEMRLYKTLCGDPSDKIPGMPKFGPKAFVQCDMAKLQLAVDALVAGHARPALFTAAGVAEGMAIRMCEADQAELLRSFHKVVGFLPLPADWEEGIIVGKEDQQAGDQLLLKYHH